MAKDKIIYVAPRQTLADVALQYCGTIAAEEAIAKASGIDYNTRLVTGQELTIPASAPVNSAVLAYLTTNNVKPSTPIRKTGIDYWYIGGDFIVS